MQSDSESSASSSSSTSGSRLSSPELPDAASLLAQKSKPKSVRVASDVQARDEGENPHWKLQPPPSCRLADHSLDCSEFDWDTIENDEDVEVWLVRAPSNLKAKHLEDMHLDSLPKNTSKSSRVGRLARGATNYDVWSVGHEVPTGDGYSIVTAAGEEANGLSCLLPRKSKKGRLYIASKPISRRLIVTSQAVTPALPPSDGQALPPESLYQNPPRPSYSEEVLTHRFMPYGSLIGTGAPTTSGASNSMMNVDVDTTMPPLPVKKPKSKQAIQESAVPAADAIPTLGKKKKPKADEGGKEKSGKKRKPEEKEANSKQAKKPKLNASYQ